MEKLIRGLHHVTATVTDAQADLDFYAKLLGLRLVKKTVNFDNHKVFHFYYGNGTGTPSTLMTTFPYKGWGVPVGRQGAGQITVTSFSVPATSLPFWRSRLAAVNTPYREDTTPFGEAALVLVDPSGLRIRLVGAAADAREPWVTPDVGADVAIRGLHSVTLSIRRPAPSLAFLTEVLGFAVVNEAEGLTRVAVGTELPGHLIEIADAADAPDGVNGLGTVHHVAFAVADADEQLRARAELLRMGCHVTEVRDRQYFTSIYFREPGGVLYEIATVGPGFMVDEAPSDLGQALKLPPWEEPRRAVIEAGLPPIAL
jgi:glyoxalase family protein